MDRCHGRHPEHLQAIVPAEGMYLRLVHRRLHHGIHQSYGYRNQARRLHHTASGHHHPVSRAEGESAHLLCRIFRTLPQRSQHHPVHHELVLQDYRSSRDTAQRNPRFLFPGLLRIACPHIHRAVHAQDANGAERAGHPALWCQRAIQQPSRLPKQD